MDLGNLGGRRGMRRRVRTGQLVLAEVAGVAVVGSAFAPRWVLIGVSVLASAALVATFGRAGGRWWWEAIVLSHRFRRRRALAAAQVLTAAIGPAEPGAGGDVDGGQVPVAVAWLRTLAPALTLRPVTVGTQTVAVGADGDGWFAVAELGSLWGDDALPPTDASELPESPWAPDARALRLRAGSPPVPYRDLATLLDQVSAVQVVLIPGPTPDQARPAWVAVRVTPGDAVATERTGGVSAVERTVAAAAAKAVRTLETAGWTARPVAPDGLVPVLAEAVGLDGPPQEHWSWWRAGRTVRAYYVAHGWTPAHGTLAAGVAHLAVSFQRRTAGSDPAVLAAVSAAPAALRRTCQDAVTAAGAQAVRLQRLDGEQAPAVWATAPTAAPFPK
jgi:hypothetical protein